MPIKVEAINQYIKLVVGNLQLKSSYRKMVGDNAPIILVEGSTDQQFINSCIKIPANCEVVSNLIKGSNILKHDGAAYKANCKQAICYVVYGLSAIPALIKCPNGADKWPLYGLVDQDFDDFSSYQRSPRIFITDTHDLETMLIYSDRDALSRISDLELTEDEINQAKMLAYELSLIKRSVADLSDLKPSLFYSPDGLVEYQQFLDKKDINIKLATEYLNEKNNNPLNNSKKKKLVDDLIKCYKKIVNADGTFTFNIEKKTVPSDSLEFWQEINGHDFLSALITLNQSAYEKYWDINQNGLNREFEVDLINSYNLNQFPKTKLYGKMNAEGLVEISR